MEGTQTRLLIPGLRGFYNWAQPISWLLVRITGGPYSLDRRLGREL